MHFSKWLSPSPLSPNPPIPIPNSDPHTHTQRLVELSVHFSKQPPGLERGSPFAPLFAAKGPEVVPKLSRKTVRMESAGAAAPLLPTSLF